MDQKEIEVLTDLTSDNIILHTSKGSVDVTLELKPAQADDLVSELTKAAIEVRENIQKRAKEEGYTL